MNEIFLIQNFIKLCFKKSLFIGFLHKVNFGKLFIVGPIVVFQTKIILDYYLLDISIANKIGYANMRNW